MIVIHNVGFRLIIGSKYLHLITNTISYCDRIITLKWMTVVHCVGLKVLIPLNQNYVSLGYICNSQMYECGT